MEINKKSKERADRFVAKLREGQFLAVFAGVVYKAAIKTLMLPPLKWNEFVPNDKEVEKKLWGAPVKTEAELLERALLVRRQLYELQHRRIAIAHELSQDYRDVETAGYCWFGSIAAKLLQSVVTSQEMLLDDSPLSKPDWQAFKSQAMYHLGQLEVDPTPGAEEDYTKRYPAFEKEGRELEAKLQAVIQESDKRLEAKRKLANDEGDWGPRKQVKA